jgi:hypothetical protein
VGHPGPFSVGANTVVILVAVSPFKISGRLEHGNKKKEAYLLGALKARVASKSNAVHAALAKRVPLAGVVSS